MTRPADTYREMFRQELSVFRPVTGNREIIDHLESCWDQLAQGCLNEHLPSEQRAARLIWAGVGLLAFGRLDHLEDTLLTVMRFPQSAGYMACRYHAPGIAKLLPLPEHLSPLEHPKAVLDWFRANRDRLHWNEEQGAFVLVGEAATAAPR